MTPWKYWLMVQDGEVSEFTPIEFADDGTIKHIVMGMCMITSLDEMKKMAERIWQVDDLDTLANPRVVHPFR